MDFSWVQHEASHHKKDASSSGKRIPVTSLMHHHGSHAEARVVRALARVATEPLRILLIEDDDADADLISYELRQSGMTTMIARVDSAELFAEILESFSPDVVLSDQAHSHFDSIAVMELLRVVRPRTPVIIVAGAFTGAQSVAAIRAGAEDLVLKSKLSRLAEAIRDALDIRRPLHALTARQIEVLALVAEGHRTRAIAKRLGLSVKTIESHRGEIMRRLHLHDVVSLARYAIRVGLIPSRL